jgi:hypothetical protein
MDKVQKHKSLNTKCLCELKDKSWKRNNITLYYSASKRAVKLLSNSEETKHKCFAEVWTCLSDLYISSLQLTGHLPLRLI